MKARLEDKENVESWYLGYFTALRVLENSVSDLVENGKKTFSIKDVKEMIRISKTILETSYQEEFNERILN